jgi:hypothetical protein
MRQFNIYKDEKNKRYYAKEVMTVQEAQDLEYEIELTVRNFWGFTKYFFVRLELIHFLQNTYSTNEKSKRDNLIETIKI